MRKFTLYQASRYTKISRYKLEQAIDEGILECETGKGNVKCYILESELNKFIESYGDQYKRFTYPEDKPTFSTEELLSQRLVPKDTYDQLIGEKDKVIALLEQQVNQGNLQQSITINKLTQLVQECMEQLPESNKNNIQNQLNELSSNLNTINS